MLHPIVNFFTFDFPYASEAMCFFMAVQGSMIVRKGPNKNKTMNWFHALLKSTVSGYAGSTFTNFFMGRPTSLISNDLFFGTCLLAFVIINFAPFDIGYKLFDSLPGEFIYTVFAQLFRVEGVTGFSDKAYSTFKDNPSKYYPIPVFGPILFPTILGNMGGFFDSGFDGHLKSGMPWAFQQGLSCATFYHFYAHDSKGFVGTALRKYLKPVARDIMVALGAVGNEVDDDILFAKFVVGAFMITAAVLRMPALFGPTFSPFTVVTNLFVGGKKKVPPSNSSSKKKKNKKKTQ